MLWQIKSFNTAPRTLCPFALLLCRVTLLCRVALVLIGKYRDWVFSPERLAEITLKYEFGMKERMYKAGINYLRNHYPQYDHLSDEEVMEQELHKKLWQDVSERKKGKKLNRKKGKAEKKDDEDVPEELKSTSAPPKENEYDTDANHFKRWDYVLNEMIFAFEHKVDDSWEDDYRSGEHDILWVPVDKDGNEVPKGEHKFMQMSKGPKDTYECDYFWDTTKKKDA